MTVTINVRGKRSYSECDGQSNPSKCPIKKRRTNACLRSIECAIPEFTDSKLRVNPRESALAAKDSLFLNPSGAVNEKYTRWVIACKFMIAANWKVPGCRIPENMHFFVDDQKNLCALIEDEHAQNTRDIVQHCHQIETSVVRKYRRQRTNGGNVTNSEEEMVYIVRIPFFYYRRHFDGSFYKVCCRVASHLHDGHHHGHPLFHILFQNIANFDSFKLSVPRVALRGSLYAMFCQFGCGVYDHRSIKRKHAMSTRELESFLGIYDCWKEMSRRTECRKMVYHCAVATGTDSNVMGIIVQLAGLDEMDDDRVLQWTDSLQETSTAFLQYEAELLERSADLEEVADPH